LSFFSWKTSSRETHELMASHHLMVSVAICYAHIIPLEETHSWFDCCRAVCRSLAVAFPPLLIFTSSTPTCWDPSNEKTKRGK
jgi:hypothetical protein